MSTTHWQSDHRDLNWVTLAQWPLFNLLEKEMHNLDEEGNHEMIITMKRGLGAWGVIRRVMCIIFFSI